MADRLTSNGVAFHAESAVGRRVSGFVAQSVVLLTF